MGIVCHSFSASTHTYDLNGNLKTDETFKYNWDYANRLGEIRRKQDDTLIVTFKVNPFGQRIEQDAISPPPGALDFAQYFHDGARVVEERDSADAVAATYVWGNGIDELLQMQRGGLDRYFHENSIGSVYLVTDAAGTNLEKYDYELYGKPTIFAWDGVQWVPQTDPISPIKNPYLFQGREFDFLKTAQGEKSELYYFRARYLQPGNMGRFLSRDPLEFDALLNQYTFLANNPANRRDPFGLISFAAKISPSEKAWGRTVDPPVGPLGPNGPTRGITQPAGPGGVGPVPEKADKQQAETTIPTVDELVTRVQNDAGAVGIDPCLFALLSLGRLLGDQNTRLRRAAFQAILRLCLPLRESWHDILGGRSEYRTITNDLKTGAITREEYAKIGRRIREDHQRFVEEIREYLNGDEFADVPATTKAAVIDAADADGPPKFF